MITGRERDLLHCLTHALRLHKAESERERANTAHWVQYHLMRAMQGMSEKDQPGIIHEDLAAWLKHHGLE